MSIRYVRDWFSYDREDHRLGRGRSKYYDRFSDKSKNRKDDGEALKSLEGPLLIEVYVASRGTRGQEESRTRALRSDKKKIGKLRYLLYKNFYKTSRKDRLVNRFN